MFLSCLPIRNSQYCDLCLFLTPLTVALYSVEALYRVVSPSENSEAAEKVPPTLSSRLTNDRGALAEHDAIERLLMESDNELKTGMSTDNN